MTEKEKTMTRDEALKRALRGSLHWTNDLIQSHEGNATSDQIEQWSVEGFLNSLKASGYEMNSEVELSNLRDRLAAAERGQKEAIAQMCRTARELGEAQGKLAGSELPGIIDGWRERAEAAERERDEARAVNAKLEGICADWKIQEESDVQTMRNLRTALEKAREGLESAGRQLADGNRVLTTGTIYATIAAIDAALKGE
jgi:hypothetical protein